MLPRLIRSLYKFNPKLGTIGAYITRRLGLVSDETIRREAEKVLGGVKGEMSQLSKRLQAGEISLQEWFDGMKSRMKVIHGIHGSLAKGGWARMTFADWGAIGQITRFQYERLNNFATEIQSGKQPLNGVFLRRTEMYADASRGTYEDIGRREASRVGWTHEKRELGAADHCRTQGALEGCVELAAKGWQPIGTLPRIAETPCRTNCKCNFIYGRMVNGRIVQTRA